MKRREYSLSFQKAEKAEKELKKFFLKEADMVRFTHRPIAQTSKGSKAFVVLGVGKSRDKKSVVHGDKKDPFFVQLLKELQKDFVKKARNDLLFYGIKHKGELFDHYFYRLSSGMKKRLNSNSLCKPCCANYPMRRLPYFEDPTFYKKGKMIGSIISHEPMVFLFLTDDEKKGFDRLNVEFDN